MHKSENRRRTLYEEVADAVEFPVDAVARIPVFTVRGLHEAEIDGCDGILEYGETLVVLSAGKTDVRVDGEYLTLSDFREGRLTVRGNIRSIDFSGGTPCSDESADS